MLKTPWSTPGLYTLYVHAQMRSISRPTSPRVPGAQKAPGCPQGLVSSSLIHWTFRMAGKSSLTCSLIPWAPSSYPSPPLGHLARIHGSTHFYPSAHTDPLSETLAGHPASGFRGCLKISKNQCYSRPQPGQAARGLGLQGLCLSRAGENCIVCHCQCYHQQTQTF